MINAQRMLLAHMQRRHVPIKSAFEGRQVCDRQTAQCQVGEASEQNLRTCRITTDDSS